MLTKSVMRNVPKIRGLPQLQEGLETLDQLLKKRP